MTALVMPDRLLSDITAARVANCFVCHSVVTRDNHAAMQNSSSSMNYIIDVECQS